MLFHHSAADYNAAASAAAKSARDKIQAMIAKGQANALQVVERVMNEVPTDRIVKGEKVHFAARVVNEEKGEHVIDAVIEDQPFRLHKHAMAQVRERLHIPAAYSDYLLGEKGWGAEKLARDMEEIVAHENARYLTREVGGEVRGWLSDQFRRLDSRPLLEAFVDSASEAGLVPVEGYALDTKIAFKALLPIVFEPIPNEVMAFGLKWGNSDYGNGKHNVHAFVVRLWCTNYAIAEDVLSQVHLGGRLPDNLIMSQQTYQLDTQTSVSAMRDVVAGLLSPAKVNETLEAIKESHERDVNPRNAFDVIAKRLQKKEVEAVKSVFEGQDTYNLPEGKTAWRLSNAVSWIANATEDRERALDMMRLAGEIAKLPAGKAK